MVQVGTVVTVHSGQCGVVRVLVAAASFSGGRADVLGQSSDWFWGVG